MFVNVYYFISYGLSSISSYSGGSSYGFFSGQVASSTTTVRIMDTLGSSYPVYVSSGGAWTASVWVAGSLTLTIYLLDGMNIY
jgi:hypothetical protein